MRHFAWDPALETGCVDIDDQHRGLFDLANALESAIDARAGGHADEEAVANAVYGLVDYVVEHFEDEQHLMDRYRYPGRGPHRALHEQLSAETLGILARYTNGEELAPSELAPLVCGWLTGHVAQHDRSVVAFVERIDARLKAVPDPVAAPQ